MAKFKKGDRVRDKSRTGPYMMVKGYSSTTGEVMCKWFDDHKRDWKEGLFEEEELMLAVSKAPRAGGHKNIGEI